jgi:hydrophobe/amphiphile efflux-1 (HAE1) family protein
VSTVLSAFNSLTLSPALAALLLRPRQAKPDPFQGTINALLGWFFVLFNSGFKYGTTLYGNAVRGLVRVSVIVLVVYGGLLLLTYYGFTVVPTGFIPEQDKGYLLVNVQLPDAASVERTRQVMATIEAIARKVDGVAHTVGISGQSLLLNANASNFGSLYVMLKPFDQRRGSALRGDAIAATLRERLHEKIDNALVGVFGAPPIDGLGAASGFKVMVEDRGNLGLAELQKGTDKLVEAANATKGLQGVSTSLRVATPWLYLDIDRDKVSSQGISLDDVFTALQVYLGSYYVNNFTQFGRTWQVNVMADPRYRFRVANIRLLQVRNSNGDMVPLGSFATPRVIGGPVLLTRYNMYPAAAVTGRTALGTGSADAVPLIEEAAHASLPPAMRIEWTELSFLQIAAGNTALIVFALAVLLVFLVLAAQYENWSLPLAVILVVPMCLLCSIFGVVWAGLDVNIFTQIGFVVLVGLASKNAILIVEFAKQLRERGTPLTEATIEASKLRLRPILMTSFAFILGVVPLVLAEGAGAEMRRTLGMAVFSGMLGVTLFGIFLTPVFFYVIQWFVTPRADLSEGPASRDRLSGISDQSPGTDN